MQRAYGDDGVSGRRLGVHHLINHHRPKRVRHRPADRRRHDPLEEGNVSQLKDRGAGDVGRPGLDGLAEEEQVLP